MLIVFLLSLVVLVVAVKTNDDQVQETILDELNVMVEKEAATSQKLVVVEEENRALKIAQSKLIADQLLLEKQYKLLEEANKGCTTQLSAHLTIYQ